MLREATPSSFRLPSLWREQIPRGMAPSFLPLSPSGSGVLFKTVHSHLCTACIVTAKHEASPMTLNSQDSPTDASDEDRTTHLAFYFFVGTLGFALLAALWMLLQTVFL